MSGLDVVQSFLGPPRCEGCGAHRGALCDGCAMRLGPPVETATIRGVDRVLAAWEYEGAARNLVLALKLRAARSAAGPLVVAMRAQVMAHGLFGEVVTWVPGRPRDTVRRGYDHAEVLARRLAACLGLPAVGLLHRTRDPVDQTTLGAAARHANLRGAFGARASPPAAVVVDDLVTTGATASACARALRAAGAATVEVIVPCRA